MHTELAGRDELLAVLVDRVDGIEATGGALVLVGDPGIGKSALVRAAAMHARARGHQVVEYLAVPSETRLPYAGLASLLEPFSAATTMLPGAQAEAVAATMGRTCGPVVDPALVPLAALNLLREAAVDRPVVLAVDDLQWLDERSTDILRFVARRLERDPILLLGSSREAGFARGVDELEVTGLDRGAAGELVNRSAPSLSPVLRRRLITEAAGNPLALTELALAWSALPPGTVIADHVPLTSRLTALFTERLDTLSAPTRDLLLVAALDGGSFTPQVFEAASAMCGATVDPRNVDEAIAARLLRRERDRVRCHHPLVPAAIGGAAVLERRRAAHAALASAHVDPDRVAWHRAASTDEPDEEIVKNLLAAADRAQRRGATAEAVAALERAATFAHDPVDAGAHLVQAAEFAVELGQPDVVVRLLDLAEPLDLRPIDRARLRWRRSMLDGGSWRDANQVRTMVRLAVEHAHRGDTEASLDALVTIALTGWWTNFDLERRTLVHDAVHDLDVLEHDPRRLAVLGVSSPAESGAEVLAALDSLDLNELDVRELALIGAVAGILGHLDFAADALEIGIQAAQQQGRVNTLSSLFASRSTNAWQTGEWARAGHAALGASRLGEEVGRPVNAAVGSLVSALLSTMRGEVGAAVEAASEVEARFRPLGAEPLMGLVAHVRGLAALVEGDAERAWDHLRSLFDPARGDALTLLNLIALDAAIDAAALADRRTDGRRMVEQVAVLATSTTSPALRDLVAYGRAILTEPDDDADDRFDAARSLIRSSSPLAAKLDLAHGIRLRRVVGPTAARAKLRAARDGFDALGAVVMADRARQELRAAGETTRASDPGAATLLTPQELEIAVLAAAGLTNREIGRQLFLSHRTVGSHLYNTFPKLGITSRSQLRAALGDITADRPRT